MALGWRRHFGDVIGWSNDLCELSTSHRLLFVRMVELLAKAALEEGTWTERWRWGRRWYLRFCHDGMGIAEGLSASRSASASTKNDKPCSENYEDDEYDAYCNSSFCAGMESASRAGLNSVFESKYPSADHVY